VIKSPNLLSLGKAPRLAYPLVVFLIRDELENEVPDDTVLLMNVIHLQDSLCPLPTSVNININLFSLIKEDSKSINKSGFIDRYWQLI
jgi:hypothetical protein